MSRLAVTVFVLGVSLVSTANAEDDRSAAHQQFANELWAYLQGDAPRYREWKTADTVALEGAVSLENAASAGGSSKYFLNQRAQQTQDAFDYGSIVVNESLADDGESLVGITVFYRVRDGYDSRYNDWYWVHYLPDGTAVKTSADRNFLAKPGFATAVEDGRLWIFQLPSAELIEFHQVGEPAKHVIRPGIGPQGMTVKSPSNEVITDYMVAQTGFVTRVEDGRVWVFRTGSPALAEFESKGEPAKFLIRPAAGPLGMTVKAADGETIDAYLDACRSDR